MKIDLRQFVVTTMFTMVVFFGIGISSVQDKSIGSTVKGDPSSSLSPEFNPSDEISKGNQTQETHIAAGKHLLVDIKNIEADFLNSEERLSHALVETVRIAGFTLLSYHCHALNPAGVSCVGVLLESHISFHTWPEEGVITLDLFTCGDSELMHVVPVIERLFGIPRVYIENENEEDDDDDDDDDDDEYGIIVNWSHESRGFKDGDKFEYATKEKYLHPQNDLSSWIFSDISLPYKKQILSVESEHHHIDIWDIRGPYALPSYDDGKRLNFTSEDPRWRSKAFAPPTRILFMNGAIQVTSKGFKEPDETLVHPAMFTHPKPVNIAVVGGGAGGSIREILKHNTVESITLIEIDSMIIDIAREYLPSINDCSNIVDVAPVCFDDDRVDIVIEDAKSWFIDRFGSNPTKQSPVETFDVIFLDLFDATDSRDLVNYEPFLKALMNSLSEDGIVGFALGDSLEMHDLRGEVQDDLYNKLERNSAAMFEYEEAHTGYAIPSAFLTICKSAECREGWHAMETMIDYQISLRIRESKNGEPSLIHYDGSMHRFYQSPSRAMEEAYCLRIPVPFECNYRHLDLTKDLFKFNLDDEEESSFELKEEIDETGKKVTAIVSKENIPKGSYIMPQDLAASFTIERKTIESLRENVQYTHDGKVSVIKNFLDFVDGNGRETVLTGRSQQVLEVGPSSLIRKSSNVDEVNVSRWMPSHPSGQRPVFSPVYDRHYVSYDVFLVASRDIQKGEELVRA